MTIDIRALMFMVACLGLACGRPTANEAPRGASPVEAASGDEHVALRPALEVGARWQVAYVWESNDPLDGESRGTLRGWVAVTALAEAGLARAITIEVEELTVDMGKGEGPEAPLAAGTVLAIPLVGENPDMATTVESVPAGAEIPEDPLHTGVGMTVLMFLRSQPFGADSLYARMLEHSGPRSFGDEWTIPAGEGFPAFRCALEPSTDRAADRAAVLRVSMVRESEDDPFALVTFTIDEHGLPRDIRLALGGGEAGGQTSRLLVTP